MMFTGNKPDDRLSKLLHESPNATEAVAKYNGISYNEQRKIDMAYKRGERGLPTVKFNTGVNKNGKN